MSTVYVVRPDERGVYTYNSWCIEHSWTTPFHEEGPLLRFDVLRCSVRPNSVCEHGWFCTDNREVAVMVDELRKERAAVVAWLHEVAERIRRGEYHPSNRENAMLDAADIIERGEHRREEKP